jgi:hypothetical protein
VTVSGDRVYNPADKNFGYVRGDRVFGLDGRYRGTITGSTLVYRSTDSARMSGVRAASVGTAGSATARRAGSAVWGDEPNIDP